eukprot:g4879.t1
MNSSSIAADVQDNLSENYIPDAKVIVGFCIICTASYSCAQLFPALRLPKITGYLAMGILAGPYVLNMVPKSEVRSLRAVDETSLAFIAVAAGAKLWLRKMRPVRRAIMWICLLLIVLEYIVGFGMVMAVRGTFGFLVDMDPSAQVAVALLAGAMMVARSPSSALAVVSETRSKGRFTSIMLGVTILSDIAVLVLYNLNSLIAESVLDSEGHNPGVAALAFFARIGIAIVLGVAIALLLNFIIFWQPRIRRKSLFYPLEQLFKHVVLLGIGLLVYVIAKFTAPWVDALLTCMCTGAALTNLSHNRTELRRMIKRLDKLVYCFFFTLTGASLELDILVHAFAIALVLVISRIFALFLGSYAGGAIAGENKRHSSFAGFCYITQAGVTLGLAKEVHLNFPAWGSYQFSLCSNPLSKLPSSGYFATMIIATVVINQLIGPPLMRWALRQIGDAMRGDSVNAEKVIVVGISNDHKRVLDSLSMMQWDIIEANIMVESPQGQGVQLGVTKADFATAVAKEVAEGHVPSMDRNPLGMMSGRNHKSKFRLLDPIDREKRQNDDGGEDNVTEDPDADASDASTEGLSEEASEAAAKVVDGAEAAETELGGQKDRDLADRLVDEGDVKRSDDSNVDDEREESSRALITGEEEVDTLDTTMEDDARWSGFQSSVDASDMLREPDAVQKVLCYLLTSQEPINVVLVLEEDPSSCAAVIQAFAKACDTLGRTEILEIVVPVEDRGSLAVKQLVDAPSAMGPSAADAVDVILIEPGDRVPLLLDINVKEIRHRMSRHRRKKQLFLPRRSYATDGKDNGEQKTFRDARDDSDDSSNDIEHGSGGMAASAGDVEMTDVVKAAI